MPPSVECESLPKLWVVVPCFFDVQSFIELKRRLKRTLESHLRDFALTFVLIDDTGGQDLQIRETLSDDVLLVTVPYNLGHQGAIVYGLRRLAPLFDNSDYIITMDCDGEDCPEDVPQLLDCLMKHPQNLFKVAIAQRTKRKESITFKILYFCFKVFFHVLTGSVVRNGNFAAFRGWFARNVLFHPYFDYCYSSSLLALRLNRQGVPLARGLRYFGLSKMTLLNLVSHGFRMLLPFAERIAIRSIILSGMLSVLTIVLFIEAVCHAVSVSPYAPVFLNIAVCSFVFTSFVAATSCILFQLFNQTSAISLRRLTCVSSETSLPVSESFAESKEESSLPMAGVR